MKRNAHRRRAGPNHADSGPGERSAPTATTSSFVTVRIEDKDGNLCPLADNLVRFKVAGAGTIAAVDNGNAATIEPFQADYRKAFNGLALLIVRSQAGQAGRVQITATSDGLAAGQAIVATTAR